MTDRPLGIADIIEGISDRDPAVRSLAGYVPWYWCRRHQRAEHASEGPEKRIPLPGGRSVVWCIRIGPFMSEAEANRLGEIGYIGSRPALGMEVET